MQQRLEFSPPRGGPRRVSPEPARQGWQRAAPVPVAAQREPDL